jgi:hypothetical protein
MTGYKAYNKGLICRNFQYKEGETYEEEKAIPCECGFHYCHEPFDVWDYYGMFDQNGDFSEYSTVEPQAEELTDDDKKFCTTKIKIGAKLSFAGFIKAGIGVLIEKTKEIKDGLSDKGKDSAQIGSSGYYAKIGSSGYFVKIGSSGYYAKIGSSGDYAQIGSSGYSAQIGSSGDSAQIGSSGDYAQIASEGEDSVICCAGIGSTARAKKGSWITLSEWKYDEEKERYVPICVKTEQVDGERIKEDTFYCIEGGEFVEVK